MLSSVAVRNFQSLHHVEVELGPLTVIVGPSSSGKSAFGRALRMVAGNARGSSFITHGEAVCTVEVETDRGRLILRKGKEDSYVVVPSAEGEQQRTFTKLAGVVPPEVTEFLGIPPKDAINFAGQFDRPYLLDDTGNEVARTLGDLTNVTMVLEASREARRLSLAAGSTLRTRKSDLAADEARIPEYRGLKEQREALTRAEDSIRAAGIAESRLDRLDTLVDSLRTLGAALKTLADIPEVPDMGRVREAQAIERRLTRLNALVAALKPVPEVPAAPPSSDAARAMLTRLQRLDALIGNLSTQKQAVDAAEALGQEASIEVVKLTAEREDLVSRVGDPRALHTAAAWLRVQGPQGGGPDHYQEHTWTIEAMEAS